jgi:response regulator of citrate/malate metabolism
MTGRGEVAFKIVTLIDMAASCPDGFTTHAGMEATGLTRRTLLRYCKVLSQMGVLGEKTVYGSDGKWHYVAGPRVRRWKGEDEG